MRVESAGFGSRRSLSALLGARTVVGWGEQYIGKVPEGIKP